MNKKRLTILRDALIEHAKNPGNLKFDLRAWTSVNRKYADDYDAAVRGALRGKNYCGTAACAVGLACVLPEFNKIGLALNYWGTPVFVDEHGNEEGGFWAASAFFELEMNDASELFSADSYIGEEKYNPLAVADKITALLECA